jgi:hypothetical protein
MLINGLYTLKPAMGASYYGHKSVGTGLMDLWSFSKMYVPTLLTPPYVSLGYQVPALKFKNTQENDRVPSFGLPGAPIEIE